MDSGLWRVTQTARAFGHATRLCRLKRAMLRFTEFINTASEKLADELISPNAVFHVPGRPEPMRGPAGYPEIIGMMRGGRN